MRFRFTIRDLLWLTVVVALVAAWFIDNRRQARQHEQFAGDAAKQIQSLKDTAKAAETKAELWQAKLRQKIIGVPLENEDALRKELPSPNLDNQYYEPAEPVPKNSEATNWLAARCQTRLSHVAYFQHT